MISQRDIAGKLGISQVLVCRVLSGRMGTTRVSPQLRRKIIRTADALGYRPDCHARGIFSGKHGAIAIFIKPWGVKGTEFVQTVLEGISEELRPTMYHTWLCIFKTARQFQKRMDIRERQNQVDALLIGGIYHKEMLPVFRKLEKIGVPIVTFFEYAAKPHIPNVTVDTRMQGRLATEHLIARGCRRIAHFSIHTIRTKGYRDALRAAGLPHDPRLVVKARFWEIEEGHRAARELLDRNVAFDAIFAPCDHLAFGALRELTWHGIRVPQDVKIIGVDDSPLSQAGSFRISTVTSECRALGHEAVDMISCRLAGETVKSRYLLPHVIQRDSS